MPAETAGDGGCRSGPGTGGDRPQGKTDCGCFFTGIWNLATGGLRGVIGAGTNRMNVYTVAKASQGLADYVIKHFPAEQRRIAVSYDSRIKSDLFARHRFRCVCGKRHYSAHVSGAHAHPLPVLCGAGVTLRGSIMVTASHNRPNTTDTKCTAQTAARSPRRLRLPSWRRLRSWMCLLT